jgi:hypothetical protein
VCDTLGNCANSAVYTIIGCQTPPTAVADSFCVVCGQPTPLPILNNDIPGGSPLDITSIQIIIPPSNGSITIPNDGTVVYTPNPNFVGADQFRYHVSNSFGVQTPTPAVVDIDVICSGTDGALSVCS